MESTYKVLIFLLHFATLGCSQQCEYLDETITCQEIQQEEFLGKILTLAATYPEEYINTIRILNSNFSIIDYLPNPSKYIDQFRVKTLVIENSSIIHIEENAFEEYSALQKVILRNNQMKNTSFAKALGSRISILDLSRNSIEILDLDDFETFTYTSSINLRENNIDSIRPASQSSELYFLDVSYNNLQEFNETYLNFFTHSIDLSYNSLDSIFLDDTLRQRQNVNIRRNNVFSLGGLESHYYDELHSTSIINDTMSVGKVLSFKDSNIGILDSTSWDISRVFLNRDMVLDLSNASIFNISQNFFDKKFIRTLNLSHNNISSIEHGIFNSQIDSVDLSFSNIKNISGNAFNGLVSVRLNLSGNQFETIQDICEYVKFQYIDLSFNAFRSIGSDIFSNCSGLYELKISNSLIESIEPGILSSIPIQTIDLSSSNISHLKAFTFSNSSSISQIILSNNSLKILESNVFYNLSVRSLEFYNSTIYYISTRAFNNLYYLSTLDLSGCGILHMEEDAFFDLPRIENIDLHNNKLIAIQSHTFRNMKYLMSLNLSWNKIELLNAGSFDNVKVASLDLSSNKLIGIQNNSFNSAEIGKMLLIHNNISAPISFDHSTKVTSLSVTLNGVYENISISSIYLNELYLVNSSILLLRNNSFVGFPYLKVLYFNSSRIASMEQGALRGLYSLEQLDSITLFNYTETLRNRMFSDLHKLKTLHINSPTLNTLEEASFSNLQSLEILNITGTSIQTLPPYIFEQLENLRILDLSQNSLAVLNSNTLFKNLPRLTSLYLQRNRISNLALGLFNNLHKLEIIRLDINSLNGLVAGVFEGLDDLKVLNVSHNPSLFQNYGANKASALRTLNNLQSLYVANTYIDSVVLDYINLKTFFPLLEVIDINNNRFSCVTLSNILNYFNSRGIMYTPMNPTYNEQNLNGITCSYSYN